MPPISTHRHMNTHTYTITHTRVTYTHECTHIHEYAHILVLHSQTGAVGKPGWSSWATAWGGWCTQAEADSCSMALLRSVYLHNNRLSNTGLPSNAFRGSEAITTLSLSSNQLSYLPPSLPASLERLHLQVHTCLGLWDFPTHLWDCSFFILSTAAQNSKC